MNKPLRKLDDMPADERKRVLQEIGNLLTEAIFKFLPTLPLDRQIEALLRIDDFKKSVAAIQAKDDDATFLSDVMSQLSEVLS